MLIRFVERVEVHEKEDEKDIDIRLKKIQKEITREDKFDYTIINSDFDKACLMTMKKIKSFTYE